MPMPAGLSEADAVSAIEKFLDQEVTETPAPNPDPQTKPPTQAKPPTPEENPEPESEQEPELQAEGEEQPEQPEGEDESGGDLIDSIESLAAHFETEPAEVMQNLTIEGPDGERVTLADVVERWREADSLVTARRGELEAEHRELIERTTNEQNGRLAEMFEATKALVDVLKTEYSAEKLARLRHEDPDAWAEAIERQRSIHDRINRAAAIFEENDRRRAAQSSAEIQKVLETENAKLLKAKPEWRERSVRHAAMNAGQALLRELGWSQQEIDSVVDHRVLLLVDMAVKGKKLSAVPKQQAVEELRKRGLRKPTIAARSVARRDAEGPNQNKARAQARAQLKKSGDVRDAARILEGML